MRNGFGNGPSSVEYTSSLQFRQLSSTALNSLERLPHPALIIANTDYHIQYLNLATSEWLKVPGIDDPKLALGKNPTEFFPGWEDLVQPVCELARNSSEPMVFEDYTVEVDGQVMCWDVVLIPNANAAGDISSITCILLDMTDRKSAEMAIQQKEEEYRELVQGVNSIVLRWDGQGVITFINELGERLFGYSAGELIGRNVMGTIVSEEDTSGHDLRRMIQEILENPNRYTANVNQNMRKDGSLVWIAWTNKPRFDESGRLVEILSIGTDITEQKHSEIDLQRYGFFFQHARDIIELLDQDGRILDANEAAVEAYQYSKEELLSKTIFDLRSPLSTPITIERVLQSGENGILFEAVHLRKDDTTFPVEVSARVMKVGGKPLIMNIVRNISQRKEAEQTVRESEERYRQLFEFNPLPMWVYDRESLRFIAVNDAAICTYGYTKDEFLSMTIKDIRPPEDIPLLVKSVAETRSGLGSSGLWRHRKKDGTMIYVEITTYDVFFAGRPARLVLANDVTRRRLAEERKRELEMQTREFYRRTILAATDGKLLITDPGDIDGMCGSPISTWNVTSAECIGVIRHSVERVAKSEGMDESKIFDFVLCAGEAATNVIKHATSGTASLYRVADGLLLVIADHGPGIEAIALPDVALKKGYTTAISLGMGYKEMISLADKLYLCTGPAGTTVGIEMSLHAKMPTMPGNMLLDAW